MFSEPKNAVTSKFDAFKASVNSRSNDPKSQSRPLGQAAAAPHSVIGGELKIVGNVTSSGSLELGGHVEGDVACKQVTVGKNGRVDGVVVAEDVVIEGHIKGHVRGDHVCLRSNAHVDGDIIHTTLAIEEGAFFVGSSHSSDDPTADGPADKGQPSAKSKAKAANGRCANGRKSNGHGKTSSKAPLVLSVEDVIGNDNAADRGTAAPGKPAKARV